MSTIHWKNDANGNFVTAADWTGGVVPGSKDDAVLDAAGSTAFTVTSSASATVNSIQTEAIATLSITAGIFTASNGTGAGVNAGVIAVHGGGGFTIAGTIDNTGAISLLGNPASGAATMTIGVANATLSGGGSLTLSDSASYYNYVGGAATTVTLTNIDNTISGAGYFGRGQVGIINQSAGRIDASGKNRLVMHAGSNGITNAGLIESTSTVFAGGLVIQSSTVTNTGTIEALGVGGGISLQSSTVNGGAGGQLLVAAGSYLGVQSSTISGGSLTVAASAKLGIASGTDVISVTSLTNAGTIAVSGGCGLTLSGAIANSGLISLNGATGSGSATLTVGTANVTLSGGGSLTLGDAPGYNYIRGASTTVTLTNIDNTISGAGYIGNAQVGIVNQAAGVINANGKNLLVMHAGSNGITNAGLIESTSTAFAGGLEILSSIVTNTGTIAALGVGGGISLQSSTINDAAGAQLLVAAGSYLGVQSSAITGGALSIGAGAKLKASAGTSTISVTSLINQGLISVGGALSLQATMTNAGTIAVSANCSLMLSGAIANSGLISLNGAKGSGSATLTIGTANATLSGGGSLTLGDAPGYNYVRGASTTVTLTNIDNTISGAGYFGRGGPLGIINQAAGIIDANGKNGLVLQVGSITNAGLIESTSTAVTGGLVIQSSTVINTGTIEALGAGGISLRSSTANDGAGGQLLLAAGSYLGLQSSAITGGALSLGVGANLKVTAGTSTISATSLINQGFVAVGGGSGLTLSGAIANSGLISLNGAKGPGVATLTIGTANVTLSGGGSLTLSDTAGYDRVFGASTTVTLTNIDNTISGAGYFGEGQVGIINQAAGVIDANGAHVMTLNSNSNGVANAGLVEATGAGGLLVQSAISNSGTILASGGVATLAGSLTNLSGTTLTGGVFEADTGGTMALTAISTIVTDGSTIILNGTGALTEANSSHKQVAIETTLATITAAGALEILGARNWTSTLAMSNAGSLVLGGGTFTAPTLNNTGTISGFGAIAGSLTNSGAISVQAGQTLSLQNAILSALAGTTFVVANGGTLQASNNTSFGTLDFTVILNGPGSVIQSLQTATSTELTFDAGSTGISATGALEILGGRNYTTTNPYANAGTLQLGGGTFTSGALTDAAGSTLSGFGTVASAFSDSGAVTASGGALVFTGAGDAFNAALAGTEIDFAGGTDTLNSGSSLTAGTVGLLGGAAVTLNVNEAFSGTWNQAAASVNLNGNSLTLSGTASFNAGAAINPSGTLALVGDVASVNEALTLAASFTEDSASSVSVAGGASLTLSGATAVAGTVTGTGILAFAGGTQALNTGAVLSVSQWALSGGAATTANENLSYAGAFTEDPTSTLAVSTGDTVTFTGSATLTGAVNGAGALAVAGGTTTLNSAATLGVANLSLSGGTLAVNESVSFAGTLADGAGATLAIASGDTFSASGTSTLTGTVSGAGQFSLAGGKATINAGAVLSVAKLAVNTGASLTVGANVTYAGNLTLSAGATLALGVKNLTLTGAASSLAGTVSGTGILAFGGGTQAIGVGAVFSVTHWTMSGVAATTLNTNLSYAGAFTQGTGTTFSIAAGNTLTLTGASTFAGTVSGAGTLALSGGTDGFNAGASLSVTNVAITNGVVVTLNTSLTYAGALTQGTVTTLALGSNTLSLTGTGTSLAGSMSGTGTLAFAGGSQAINAGASLGVSNWSLTGGATATLNESLTFAGTLSEDAASAFTIAAGTTLTLNGAASFTGTLSETAGATIVVGAGDTLMATGGATFAGAINGAGSLAFAGTLAPQTLNVGVTVTVANWSADGGTEVDINENLTYAGAFTAGHAALKVGAGDTLSLTGASMVGVGAGGVLVTGAGTLSLANATVNTLLIGGTATLNDAGTVVQTGAITLGDATTAAAKLTIASGATWNVAGNVGIAIGHSKTSAITLSGTLIKTAGTGVAKISPKITDSGLIEDASGTLDLAGAISGKGAMKIDAGATLELANSAAKTLTVTFNGAGATLDLAKPAKMAATIAGFTSGQTIDLLKTTATGVSLNGSDQLVVVNGAKTVATLQLTGNYAGQTFTLGSDGKGGSTITVSGPGAAPPPVLFAQAMALVGSSSGGGTPDSRTVVHPTPATRLLAPPVH